MAGGKSDKKEKKFDAYSTEKGCGLTRIDPIGLTRDHVNGAPARDRPAKKKGGK